MSTMSPLETASETMSIGTFGLSGVPHTMRPTLADRKAPPYMMMLPGLALACFLLLAWPPSLHAGNIDVSGQFSVWTGIDPEDIGNRQVGGRYIPELSYSRQLSEIFEFSTEAALNIYCFDTSGGTDSGDSDIDLYRLWMRLASPQLEVRGGLQKIGFGPAVLLRSMMWFDSIDPRDPLQLTRGVYGLLARYYFQGNANLWAWGLYGNDRLRGWSKAPSTENDWEYGCRFQTPLGPGEMAFSYHHRIADPQAAPFPGILHIAGEFAEDSFGLDGKWDIGIGLWFEAALIRRDLQAPIPRFRRMITVGADYTFNIGNGLHILAENLFMDEADEAFGPGNFSSISALAADYPLNLFDSLSTILYFDHENDDLSTFVQWQRTYDDWQVYLSVFSNPERSAPTPDGEDYAGISGDGVRLMFVYNH